MNDLVMEIPIDLNQIIGTHIFRDGQAHFSCKQEGTWNGKRKRNALDHKLLEGLD